jgi:hypothetical protein
LDFRDFTFGEDLAVGSEIIPVKTGLEDSEGLLSLLEEVGNRDCGVCVVGNFGGQFGSANLFWGWTDLNKESSGAASERKLRVQEIHRKPGVGHCRSRPRAELLIQDNRIENFHAQTVQAF